MACVGGVEATHSSTVHFRLHSGKQCSTHEDGAESYQKAVQLTPKEGMMKKPPSASRWRETAPPRTGARK